jgi:RHS repeat-associated protein
MYTFYSPSGKALQSYSISFKQAYWVNTGNGWQQIPDSLRIDNQTPLAYFGGRLLGPEDRLGSRGRYFPYGEDRTGSLYGTSGQTMFATYQHTNGQVVHYADQRWYSSTPGRFLSPDPYSASGGPGEPQTWNRYAYVVGDPINLIDPRGTTYCFVNPNTGMVESCYDSVDVTDSVDGYLGGGGGPLRTTNIPADPPSVTGRQILARGEQLAKQWLRNFSCAKLFDLSGSGFDPTQVLSSLIASGTYNGGQIRLFVLPLPTTSLGGFTYANVSLSGIRC